MRPRSALSVDAFLWAHAFAEVEIDQLAKGQRLAIFPARSSGIAAGGDLGEQALCLNARRLGRPGRTVLADG